MVVAEVADEEDEEEEDRRPRRRRVAEDEEDDEDDDRRPRRRRPRRRGRRGTYEDCPHCGAPGDATYVTYTLWGGFIGPWLLNHVRCNECGGTYNGRTGKPNTTAIILYIVVPTAIVVVVAMIAGVVGALGN